MKSKNNIPIFRVKPLRKARTPSMIGAVLKSSLRRHKLDQKFAQYQFVTRWKDLVGEEIAKRAFPEALHRNELLIRVENSLWAQELSFQKPTLLYRLRREGGFEELRDIKFVVG